MSHNKTSANQKLIELINKESCFNLQFRRDVRRKRTNHPTYYRWQVQYIITLPKKSDEKSERLLNKLQNELIKCGKIYYNKNQIRYTVQGVDDIKEKAIPFLKKVLEKEKRDKFSLWEKAINIIYGYKGKKLTDWQESDFQKLIYLCKKLEKKKNKNHQWNWEESAKLIINNLARKKQTQKPIR
ncbi:MAG TPA: hypothetical protein ENL27_00675 [Candidatus Parcubacteria bacterium]|nr:hypothetical protein [Candidatus Parcubacteria bacterium]